MSVARNRKKALAAALVGSAALMLVGSVWAQRPERRVTATQTAAHADSSAMALKVQADNAKELAGQIDNHVASIEKTVKELEDTTDKIQGSKDKSSLSQADKHLDELKATVGKLDGQTTQLRALGAKMNAEIERLKKPGALKVPGAPAAGLPGAKGGAPMPPPPKH